MLHETQLESGFSTSSSSFLLSQEIPWLLLKCPKFPDSSLFSKKWPFCFKKEKHAHIPIQTHLRNLLFLTHLLPQRSFCSKLTREKVSSRDKSMPDTLLEQLFGKFSSKSNIPTKQQAHFKFYLDSCSQNFHSSVIFLQSPIECKTISTHESSKCAVLTTPCNDVMQNNALRVESS